MSKIGGTAVQRYSGTAVQRYGTAVRYSLRIWIWTEMSKIEKRYSTAISRPILALFGLK